MEMRITHNNSAPNGISSESSASRQRRARLKRLAIWRAWFYAEAARRGAGLADSWYRHELSRAPSVDDSDDFESLWNQIETADLAGQRLRAIRKHYALTQIDMAAIIGVEQGTVSRWESDEIDITDAHLTVYSHLCQGAGLAFLRYGAAANPPMSRAAPGASTPLDGDATPVHRAKLRLVGSIGSGQIVVALADPLEIVIGELGLAPQASTAEQLIALRVAADLYPLRPGWLVVYAADDTARTSDSLAGKPARLDDCLKRLCIVALTRHPDNRIHRGRTLLREVRAAREPGRYEIATLRPYEVENAEIAWASPVLAVLPGALPG